MRHNRQPRFEGSKLNWFLVFFLMTIVMGIGHHHGSLFAGSTAPQFSLAYSEYPSWSVFGVASERGFIDGEAGKMGPIEKKWNVDIILKLAEYDPCIQMYGAGQVDAAALTTMDALNPSLGRKSVVVFPTSNSYGADALLVPRSITEVKQLKGQSVRMLAASVSQYVFERNLEERGENPDQYTFVNMDPGVAAMAMQKQGENTPIMVWNPFVLQTLADRKDVHVLFDSTTTENEIVDAIVAGADSVEREGGDRFVMALMETFYKVNELMADPATHDQALIDIGAKFSRLGLADMRTVVKQTRFYSTPQAALTWMTSDEFKKNTDRVVNFCVKRGIVPSKPVVGFGSKKEVGTVNLRIDPTYLQKYLAQTTKK